MSTLPIKKLYYSIAEVSKITGLKPFVLRYWETEFKELRPSKNRAGNRIYRTGDIELIDARGTLRVRTSNGEIEIKGHATVREAATSNGSIRIDLRDIPEDGSEISTANGSIDIYVDVDLDADLRGATSLGKVAIKDDALRLRFTASEESRNSLAGKIGEGGSLIDVSTSNGEIRFHVLKQ